MCSVLSLPQELPKSYVLEVVCTGGTDGGSWAAAAPAPETAAPGLTRLLAAGRPRGAMGQGELNDKPPRGALRGQELDFATEAQL